MPVFVPMNAVRLFEVGKPLRLENLPVPHIGPDDVLVRVQAAGICHSDARYRWSLQCQPAPR